MNHTNRTGEWEEWIIFMLNAVEHTSKETIKRISRIRDELEKTLNLVQEKAPKVYRKGLVEFLFEKPYAKIDFLVHKMGVERKAASRYLKALEDIGVLTSQKIGRELLYINTGLIEVLK